MPATSTEIIVVIKRTAQRIPKLDKILLSTWRLPRLDFGRGTDLNDVHLIANHRHVTVNSIIPQHLAAITNGAKSVVKATL